MWTGFIALMMAAYIAGSIPFGKLITKAVAKLDITKIGSGNIGAANVAREVGLAWGVMTLLTDTAKGFFPVLWAQNVLSASIEMKETLTGIIGLAALVGHQFSIYNHFKGGKGVATYLGVFLVISPVSCLLCGIVFVIIVWIWGYVSLGSIVASLGMPLVLLFLGYRIETIIMSLILSTLVIVRHRENIQRLFRGREKRWGKSAI